MARATEEEEKALGFKRCVKKKRRRRESRKVRWESDVALPALNYRLYFRGKQCYRGKGERVKSEEEEGKEMMGGEGGRREKAFKLVGDNRLGQNNAYLYIHDSWNILQAIDDRIIINLYA